MQSYKTDNEGNLLITAPVMIPNAKDCDYQNGETPLTKQQIREFAKSYEKYGFIDHEHGLTRNGKRIGVPTHSFLLQEDTELQLLNGDSQTFPTGTWFITSKLTDKTAISTAMNGGYTGYSPSILPKPKADEYLESLKSDKTLPVPKSCKSVNSAGNALIKDVPNPVVLSISLVKSPCLHQSKFCKLNDGEIMEDDVKSLKSKILDAMDMPDKSEMVALKSEVETLHSTIETMQSEFKESLKAMQEDIKTTLENALKSEETEIEASEEVETEEVEEEIETEEETSKDDEDDETEEVETEEVEESEPVAEKGHSKAEPIHDNVQAEKAKTQSIYEFLGRNPDGTRKI